MHIEIEKLKSLQFVSQLAFAYITCERLYPNYIYFSQNFFFGDISAVRRSIDHIRQCIFGISLTKTQIQQDFDAVSINTPDTDDFITVHASFALDSCCVILGSLQFLLDRKIDSLEYISRYGTDTVDRHITSDINVDIITAELEKSILNDPRMKNEISTQNEIISFLVLNPSLKESDVDLLLSRIMSQKTS